MLALPREAGTPEAAAARAVLRDHLRSLGYVVETQRFSFHPFSLDAFPLFGIGLGWLGLALAPFLLVARLPGWAAPLVWLCGLAALLAFTAGVALGWSAFGAAAREDANLVAVRPEGAVRRWIVAHSDTKAQGHSMAGRIVALWVVVVTLIVLTVLAGTRLAGPRSAPAVAAGAFLAVLAGALAARGRLRGRSAGARDNGTGLLTALVAAEQAVDGSIGVLITGAEEFGLVGARIFARMSAERLRGTDVINVDTVDDEGPLYLVSHDAAGAALVARETVALSSLGVPVRRRGLPLGVFVDSHPLARAGAPAITIGRLTWRTLRRLHTPGDTPEGMTFGLAAALGRVVARPN